MKNDAIRNTIPFDKSIVIRYLMLDLKNGNWHGTNSFIKENMGENLGDDVTAALNARLSWDKSTTINVGESGTLLRFLTYYNWQTDAGKEFEIHGTLQDRAISNDKAKILTNSLTKLLTLDGGTSQWASAAYLFRADSARLPRVSPHKLRVTKTAVDDYRIELWKYNRWVAPLDRTILNQAMAAVNYKACKGTRMMYVYVYHSEEYCLARVFDRITVEDGAARFPSLANHESNRLVETDRAKAQFQATGVIDSNDHRIVQALVIFAILNNMKYTCTNPNCVTKSWPKFWEFAKLLEAK
jgi:hypothetical protein